jgi:RHS repeat-associated protein
MAGSAIISPALSSASPIRCGSTASPAATARRSAFTTDPFQRLVSRHWPAPRGDDALYYDGPDVVLELRYPSAGGSQWVRYVHGPGADQLLATEVYPLGAAPTPGAGSQYYYHADGEGSIRLLTDANGQIANRYDYDSYGQRLSVIESLPLQPYGWKGREWIPGPNIYYNRARFYDPVLGRFMSQDPLGYEGGDWNFYSFAWSNPKNWNDPSGLDAAASYAGIAAVDVSVAPAEKAVGCALSSLFFSLSLDIASYSNVQSNGNCGATGTPPSPPQPPPPPPNPCDSNSCCSAGGAGPGGSRPPTGLNSFEGSTLVETVNGKKRIDEIQVGELVTTRDMFSGDLVVRPVVELFARTAPGLMHIGLLGAAGDKEILSVTAEHQMFLKAIGWSEARKARIGDKLIARDGSDLTIESVERDEKPVLVHNFEVAQDHSYLVGEKGAWAHNAIGSDKSIGPICQSTGYCRKIKDKCIAECNSTLPTGDNGFRFWNCLNSCMKEFGCLGKA